MTTKEKISAIREIWSYGTTAMEEYGVSEKYSDEQWNEIYEFLEEMIFNAK